MSSPPGTISVWLIAIVVTVGESAKRRIGYDTQSTPVTRCLLNVISSNKLRLTLRIIMPLNWFSTRPGFTIKPESCAPVRCA